MLNIYTLATRPEALSDLLSLDKSQDYKPIYLARPGMNLPVILNSGGKTCLLKAHWGCQTEAATMPLCTFPMDRLLSQPPFNRWIHTQRCVVPANCFFAHRDNQGPSDRDGHDTFLIRLIQSRLFLIGGLFMTEPRKNSYSFLLLTTESADVLQHLTQQMPLLLSTDHLRTWLYSEHLIDVMHAADRSGDHWFDYYAVDHDIITPGNNRRDLLKPLGASLREKEERDHKLRAIDVKQERFDRRGGKW